MIFSFQKIFNAVRKSNIVERVQAAEKCSIRESRFNFLIVYFISSHLLAINVGNQKISLRILQL